MTHNTTDRAHSVQFTFQNWPVYQESLALTRVLFGLCEKIPNEKSKGLRDQVKRSVTSVTMNIAEGAARITKRDKMNFVNVAMGSLFETVAVLDICERLGYLEKNEVGSIQSKAAEIGRLLRGVW